MVAIVALAAVVISFGALWPGLLAKAETHRKLGTVRHRGGFDTIGYHRDLCRKYERAAWMPWLALAPDAAPPKRSWNEYGDGRCPCCGFRPDRYPSNP